MKTEHIYRHSEQLPAHAEQCARSVQFFLNRETGLIVVDVVHENEEGGNEVMRLSAYAVDLSHCNEEEKKDDE